MIKVLYIHTLPVISGSGINVFDSLKRLNEDSYDAELACAPGGELIALAEGQGIRVRQFEHLVQPFDPLRDIRAVWDITLFLRKYRYQIVHTHNSKAGFIGRLAATLAGVPVIIHTVHGFAFHDGEPFWKRFLYRNLERMAAHWCDRIIFISQPLIEWALRDGIVKREKVTKIYNGIDLDRFCPVSEEVKVEIRRKWNLREDDAVIGIVSKLWEGKGHAVLIKAFTALKNEIAQAKLLIVGDGYLSDELMRLAQESGHSEDILFTGFQFDVAEITAAFDVAVLPSFFEGMGRVLLEAMAMEKPVVASRVGGIPDVVEDGINGFLVPPGNEGALAEALKRILADSAMAKRMGQAGREKIDKRFSVEYMVAAIDDVYRDVMTRKGIFHESH